jgi:hypothetical protein
MKRDVFPQSLPFITKGFIEARELIGSSGNMCKHVKIESLLGMNSHVLHLANNLLILN